MIQIYMDCIITKNEELIKRNNQKNIINQVIILLIKFNINKKKVMDIQQEC